MRGTGQINFADSAEAFALSGKNDAFLKEIADAFACGMTARGGKVEFSGEDAMSATAVLAELQRFYRGGGAADFRAVFSGDERNACRRT